MSNLKAGDLCLVIGCFFKDNESIIGKTITLEKFRKSNFSDNYGWEYVECTERSIFGDKYMIQEKFLMKISGHKEPSTIKTEEGIEA